MGEENLDFDRHEVSESRGGGGVQPPPPPPQKKKKYLGTKEHLDWLKIYVNAGKIITASNNNHRKN